MTKKKKKKTTSFYNLVSTTGSPPSKNVIAIGPCKINIKKTSNFLPTLITLKQARGDPLLFLA
jgi:hypothetical protein